MFGRREWLECVLCFVVRGGSSDRVQGFVRRGPSSVGKQQHHMKESMGNSKGNLGLYRDYTSGLCNPRDPNI